MEVFDQYELLTQFAFLPDRLLQKIREKTGILDSRNSLLERLQKFIYGHCVGSFLLI